MKPGLLRELTLYRYRYVIGYGSFFAILALAMLTYIETIPYGLTQSEMNSAVTSMHLNLRAISPLNLVDVPYHVLQKASISFLGLTPFAIKLPSILIAFGTGICLVFMLRKWFRDNVAVISSLLAVTTVPFLSGGRTGTSLIMTFFWTSLLLLAATNALHTKRFCAVWKVTGLIAALALLYSPFGIYPLIALAISGLLHPHVRHMFRSTKKPAYIAYGIIVAAGLTPLVIAAIAHPSILVTLAGIKLDGISLDKLLDNGRQLYGLFINPLGPAMRGDFIVPLFGTSTLAIMVFGFLRTVFDHHSARSYMLLIWLGFLLPLILLNPQTPFVIFVPCILLLAIGTETLIREWYDIFPFNPYARLAALIPLVILLGSIMSTNLFRYFYGHVYAPNGAYAHDELTAVRKIMDRKDINKSKILLSTTTDQRFYDLLRRDYPNLELTKSTVVPEKGTLITLGEQSVDKEKPYRIITNSRSEDAQVLSVYTKW
jgi:hypothetical protein